MKRARSDGTIASAIWMGWRSFWRSWRYLAQASVASTTVSSLRMPVRFSGPKTTIFMVPPPSQTQIYLTDAGLRAQLVGEARGNDTALLEHIGAVGEVERLGNGLLDQQHRHAL